ncbi:hypothetical protein EDB84DRAFT_1441697 [Lactarius hengduanensis]|nr:hypothetical protein EDB84DRAFT_1441697 [Lactarius hengduanensis]
MPAADWPLPSPHRPAFARNGDARGHAVPPFPFAQKRCARGHTARPFPSPFPLVRATPVRAERGMQGQRPIPWRPVCNVHPDVRPMRDWRHPNEHRGNSRRLVLQEHGTTGARPTSDNACAEAGERSANPSAPTPWAARRQNRNTVRAGRSARGQAIPASPSRSRATTAQRQARRRDMPPPLPAHARKRGDSVPTMSLGAGDTSPAPRCPHTQGEGRRAHPVPSARATLAPPHAHHTAPPVHARGGVGVQPLRMGHSGPVFTRPAIPMDAGGSVRPAQPLPHRVHLPVYAREEARARGPHASMHAHEGSRNEGRYNPGGRTEGPHKGCAGKARHGATRVPGGAACERRGVRIGAEVRKGEGDGGGVMNGAKRSQGEAAHADSGTPRASRST